MLFTYDVTICMKLDPDIHIVKHLVFFGKTGVKFTPATGKWICRLN
jgi:hypothetical protein